MARDLLISRVKYFGLFGFSKSAVLVKFIPNPILIINRVKDPAGQLSMQ